ncbi:Hydroxyneurosporene synthase (CrtC) [compost metagenome]
MNPKLFCALGLALLLGACGPPDEPVKGYAGLGQDAADYSPVEPGRVLQFPIDHGAHSGYRIEWWYITSNLKDAQGRDWGAQWTLFRSALRPGAEVAGWNSPNLWLAHAALSSPSDHRYAEKLARGGIGQAGVQAEPFHAWIDDWSLQGQAGQGLQQLQMQASGPGFSYRLQLHSDGPLVGYSVKSGEGQASWYYSQPFYRVTGEIEHDGQRLEVTGQAWLDREWSSQPLTAQQHGWDWFSLHLDDGTKLMLFQVRQSDGKPYRAGTWMAADGRSQPLRGEQIQLSELAWTTQKNGRKVATRWQVQVADHNVDVQVEAIQALAWMDTSFPYWEGPVRLAGSHGGRGYLEMTGY